MNLLLIRHGNCVENQENPSLTDIGRKQARILAKKLSKITITKVYTSDLTRAFETFEEYIKVNPQIKYEKTEKLREIYRVIIGGPEKEGTSPDRENKDKARADTFFDQITKSNLKGNVAIFAHGNLIRYFLSKAMKTNPKEAFDKITIDFCSISTIEVNNGKMKVASVNVTNHSFPF